MAAHNYGLAFAELERAIIDIAPDHIATANAPDTWAKLQDWYRDERGGIYGDEHALPVWNGASDETIYCSPQGNYSFRAWHDMTHILLHFSFCLADELSISAIHFATMQRRGLSLVACAALYFDTAGQSFYQDIHGEFPVNQRAFVVHCLDACGDKYANRYRLESVARTIAKSGVEF